MMKIFNIDTTPKIYNLAFTARKNATTPMSPSQPDSFKKSKELKDYETYIKKLKANATEEELKALNSEWFKESVLKKNLMNLSIRGTDNIIRVAALSQDLFGKYMGRYADKTEDKKLLHISLKACSNDDISNPEINEEMFEAMLNREWFWGEPQNAISRIMKARGEKGIQALAKLDIENATDYIRNIARMAPSEYERLQYLCIQNPNDSIFDFADVINATQFKNIDIIKVTPKTDNADYLKSLQISILKHILARVEDEKYNRVFSYDVINKVLERKLVLNKYIYNFESIFGGERNDLADTIVKLALIPDDAYERCVSKLGKNERTPKMLVACCNEDINNFYFDEETFNKLTDFSGEVPYMKPHNLKWLKEQDLASLAAKWEEQKNKIKKHPELYINDEIYTPEAREKRMTLLLEQYEILLAGTLKAVSILDKEALDNLFRMRADTARQYLISLTYYKEKELKLFESLVKSDKTSDRKPKEYIDLINAYTQHDLDLDIIKRALKEKDFDFSELEMILFKEIMQKIGLSKDFVDNIPQEKLLSWDIENTHLLAKEASSSNNTALRDVLRATNSEFDFKTLLETSSNPYGKINAATKKIFKREKLDYQKWVNPDKNLEIDFKAQDQNKERLQQIAAQITEDINSLFVGREKVVEIFTNRFPKFMNNNKFNIPKDYLTSDTKLTELLTILTDTTEKGQLANSIWRRAEKNAQSNNREIAEKAQNVLTILDHLKQRITDIAKMPPMNNFSAPIDWRIKMWDRIPQKDLFQGNYSTCCIGMGAGNGKAMPHYLMNTAFNMIELVDNNTGKTVGNALCYFIKKNNQPVLIIDNIEINNTVKPSDNIGKKLRDKITEYAAKIAKDITGKNNTPIYMSTMYNDVPTTKLPLETSIVSFLGKLNCDEIYLDLYEGWTWKESLTTKVEMLRLK